MMISFTKTLAARQSSMLPSPAVQFRQMGTGGEKKRSWLDYIRRMVKHYPEVKKVVLNREKAQVEVGSKDETKNFKTGVEKDEKTEQWVTKVDAYNESFTFSGGVTQDLNDWWLRFGSRWRGDSSRDLDEQLEGKCGFYKRFGVVVKEENNGMSYFIPLGGIDKKTIEMSRRGRFMQISGMSLVTKNERKHEVLVELKLPKPLNGWDFREEDFEAQWLKNGLLKVTVTGYRYPKKKMDEPKSREEEEEEEEESKPV